MSATSFAVSGVGPACAAKPAATKTKAHANPRITKLVSRRCASAAIGVDRLSRSGSDRLNQRQLAAIFGLGFDGGLGELARGFKLAGRARENCAKPLPIGSVGCVRPDK